MADEKVSNNLVQRLIFLQVSFAFEGSFLMEKIQGLTFDLAKASESRTYILPYVNLR